mgnify:CR=1 FL=1
MLNVKVYEFICISFLMSKVLKWGVLGLVQVCANGLPDTNPSNCKGMKFVPCQEAMEHYRHVRQDAL